MPATVPPVRRSPVLSVVALAVVLVGMAAWLSGGGEQAGGPFRAQLIGQDTLRFSAEQMAWGQRIPARRRTLFTCGPSLGTDPLFGPRLAADRNIWLWGFLYPGPQGTPGDRAHWRYFFSHRMYARHASLARRNLLRGFPAEGGEFYLYADRAVDVRCGVPDSRMELASGDVPFGSSPQNCPWPTDFCTAAWQDGGCSTPVPPVPPPGREYVTVGACGTPQCNGLCRRLIPSPPPPASASTSVPGSAPPPASSSSAAASVQSSVAVTPPASSSSAEGMPDLVITLDNHPVSTWPTALSYTLTVRNAGSASADAYTVVAQLPDAPEAAGLRLSAQSTAGCTLLPGGRIHCPAPAGLQPGQVRGYRIILQTSAITPCQAFLLTTGAEVRTERDAYRTNNGVTYALELLCPAPAGSSQAAASSAVSSDAAGRQPAGCGSVLFGGTVTTACLYKLPESAFEPYVVSYALEVDPTRTGGIDPLVEARFLPESLALRPGYLYEYSSYTSLSCMPGQEEDGRATAACRDWGSGRQGRYVFQLVPGEQCAWQTVRGTVKVRLGEGLGFEGMDNRPLITLPFSTEVTCATASRERPELEMTMEALPQAPAPPGVPGVPNASAYRVTVRNRGAGPAQSWGMQYRLLQASYTDGHPPVIFDELTSTAPYLQGMLSCGNGACQGGMLEPGAQVQFEFWVQPGRNFDFCRAFTSEMQFRLTAADPPQSAAYPSPVTASTAHSCTAASAPGTIAPVATFQAGSFAVRSVRALSFLTSAPGNVCTLGPVRSAAQALSVVDNLNTNVSPAFRLGLDGALPGLLEGAFTLDVAAPSVEACEYTLTLQDPVIGSQAVRGSNRDAAGVPQSLVSQVFGVRATVYGLELARGIDRIRPGSTIDFGAIVAGQAAETSFLITNAGGPDIPAVEARVEAPAGSPLRVNAPALPRPLSVGEAVPVTVRFAPQAPGAFQGTLTFTLAEAGFEPLTFLVRGVAVAP